MPTIPTLPPYPSRGSAPDQFSLQADAFVAAMPNWGVQVQAVGNQAAADAATATASMNSAVAAANYKGVYSAGTTYTVGQSVTYGSARFYAKTTNLGVTPVDGANWGIINEIPSQTGSAGRVLKTNGTTASWLPAVSVYTYASRASVRSLTPLADELVVIESLGLFRWVSGSTELDDDETAFATASGVWELVAADPEYVYAAWIAEADDIRSELSASGTAAAAAYLASKILRGSFNMSATSLATITSTSFTATVAGAAVGDSVVVNPGDGFGTTAADRGKLSYVAYVSATNTVTVTIRNASASTANMTASTWNVLVFKQ